jgi:hypothetical protein
MTIATPLPGRAARAGLAATVLLLAACAHSGATRQFDVDAFLRAPDTALPEVLTNPDFLAATRVPATQCATMLQSERSGVLEDLPRTVRGQAWLLRPTATPAQVWLVASKSSGERSCHGPLPADAVHALIERTGA